MKPIIMAVVAFLLIGSSADAGRRCNRSYYQTYASSHNWGYACWSCHPRPKAKAYDWREDMSRIAARKLDNEEFGKNLAMLTGAQYGASYAQQGGYSQSLVGEFNQAFGATQFGVSNYNSNPLVDINAVIQGQRHLAQQLASGATTSATDTADIASQVYTLENDRQGRMAAYSAILGVQNSGVPQPTNSTFRFQATIQPNGNLDVQPVQAMPGVSQSFQAAVSANCAACHTGQGSGVAKLDLNKELSQEKLEAMANAVDSGRMPLRPDGEPDEKLPLNIRNLFNSAAWPNQ